MRPGLGLLSWPRAMKARKRGGTASLTAKLTTSIYLVGKKNGVEEWIQDGVSMYETRLKSVIDVRTIYLKTDADLVTAAGSAKGKVFALDENGRQLSSRSFSKLVFDGFVEGGSHVSFLIGGFARLPAEIKQSKIPLISLSSMTWTHQFARLLLIEQLYRANEISKNSKYHKD